MVKKERRTKAFIFVILIVLAMCIAIVGLTFLRISKNYHNSVSAESAEHLIETNAQIKLFLEERFANDNEIAQSLANSISVYENKDIEGLMALIRRERDIWGLSDVYLYAENGFCIGADGDVKRSDEATDVIYLTRKSGEFVSIMQSTITYSFPVKNDLTLHDSPMAAVSIVRSIDTLVDDLGFSSFDNEAFIYLAQNNGAIISKLTHPRVENVYNILALLEKYDVTCLSHGAHGMNAMLPTDEPCAFLYTGENGESMYMVSTPIRNGSEIMRLFYFVPEQVVNSSMLGFSSTITGLSIAVISGFIVLGALIFILMYRERKRSFDSAIVARDRMLDLLVSNTRNVFALLSEEHKKPRYISLNAESVIGDKYMWLERTPTGMRMAFPSGEETEAAREINKALAQWDGKSDFVSGFTPYSASGIEGYFIMRIYPVGDEGGEYVVIAQDVTLEREREEALRSALARADSASLAKTRFLANMSHDIRTPMNAIINMTDFALESTGDRDKLTEYLRVIRESSGHLLRLINDILDMSRIESGQVSAASVPMDISACLDEICTMIAPLYTEKEQTFTADYKSLPDLSVMGDKLKLTRVLVNLLNNAVKFTGRGGHISLSARELPSLRNGSAAFRFEVSDNGPGIAHKHIERIFEPFTRVDAENSQGAEGTGLGLSICKSYVMAMGGTITCVSEPGNGSTFIVEVTFKKGGGQDARIASPSERGAVELFRGKRVLLCEDNAINRTIAIKILEGFGFIVDVACDGGEAVSAFMASPEGYYDIVYMDIQMPIMDGCEATRRIRGSKRKDAKTIPVIAMTANVFTEDVETARAAGMNGHVGKPLNVEELNALSAKLIKERENMT